MAPTGDSPAGRAHPLACPECDSRLGVDQRYCVVCGTRVRPLPRDVAAPLAALSAGLPTLLPGRVISPAGAASAAGVAGEAGAEAALAGERGGGLVGAADGPGSASPPTVGPHRRPIFQPVALNVLGSTILLPSFEMPSPSAAAATVLSILAFFVVVTQGNSLASNALVLLGGGGSSLPVTAAPVPPVAPTVTPASSASAAAPAASVAASPAAAAAAAPTPAAAGGATAGAGSGRTGTGAAASPAPVTPNNLPPIKHVWVITLGDQDYANTFSTVSSDPYLNTTLARSGEVVPAFYAVAGSDLANEDALVSGQGPTPQIINDCPTFSKVTPGLLLGNQVSGDGCVYSEHVPSLLSLMTAAKLPWKAYVQGLGGSSAVRIDARRALARRAVVHRALARRAVARRAVVHRALARRSIRRPHSVGGALTCRHPPLGAPDTATASPADGYVTWRNPVPYFGSVTAGQCASQDVGLNQLGRDLKSAKAAPTLSLIYPSPCDDGSDTGPGTACPSVPDAADPAASADAFLKTVVPAIEASPAYAHGQGLILIQFAMAAQSGPHVGQFPQAACCNTPQYPNLAGSSSTQTGTTSGSGTTATTTPTATTAPTATTTPGTTTTSAGAATLTGTVATNTATAGTATSTTDTGTTTTAPCPTGSGTGSTTSSSTQTTGTVPGSAGTSTGATATATATVPTDTSTTGTTPATTTTTASNCPGSTTSSSPAPSTDPLGNAATGGGGHVGLLAISKWVTKGSQDVFDTFNTFSLLASLEKLFGLKPALGYANTVGVTGVWGHGFFSAFTPAAH